MEARAEHLRRLTRGTAGNAAGAAFGQLAELATFAVALDRVGVRAFAVIVLGQSLVQWPYLLESGVGQAVNRLLAGKRRDEHFHDRMAAAAVVYAGLGLLTLALGAVVGHFLLVPVFGVRAPLRWKSEQAFDLLVLGAALRLGLGFVPRALVGEVRLGTLRLVELGRSGAALVATVVLVGRGPGALPAVGLALLLGDLVASAASIFVVRPRRTLGLGRRMPSTNAFRDHWQASKPLLVTSALSLGWTRTDAVIVGAGLGPVALTTYGIVLRVYDVLRSALELFLLGLVPATTRYLEEGDGAGVARLYHKALGYVGILVWPAAAVLGTFSPQIIRWWLHRGHLSGLVPAMAVAMALVVAMTPGVGALYLLTGAGQVARAVRPLIRAAGVNLALSVALLIPIGVAAVFVGTLVGTLLMVSPYLGMVTDITGIQRSEVIGGLRRPAVLLVVVTTLFVAIRLTSPSDEVLIAVLIASGLAYGAAALRWTVSTADLRRLLP